MRYLGFDKPSFAFKSIGSAVGVTLSANFVTGEYALNGAAKTFADLFTFNRAGKAWLVKNNALVEYAVDVPRFDNGLLIEQSATNTANSRTNFNSTWTDAALNLISDGSAGQTGYFGIVVNYVTNAYMTSTVWIKSENSAFSNITVGDAGIASYSVNVITGANTKGADHPLTLDPSLVSSLQGSHSKITFTRKGSQNLGTALRFNIPSSTYVAMGSGLAATTKYVQHETGKVSSSYIPITTVPVTRPADFIASKITTGSTLTGDWDATLNLSLVNGQLSWTGYGRIRSLEIN